MRDPVLERDMFRKAEATPPSDGVVSLVKEESDYERRKKQAAELLASAKERQNPENYKTLSEQNRPGVFRPVATAQPQAPQPNTQQQMAQMQAMGFRPVGMADGGYIQRFAEGSGPAGVVQYTLPDVGLRIGKPGQPAISFGDGVSTPDVNTTSDTIGDPSTWTDEEILAMAQKRLSEDPLFRKAHEEYAAKTPFGRGIQAINPFSTDPLEALIKDMKVQRAYSRAEKGDAKYKESLSKGSPERNLNEEQLKAVVKAQQESPVRSIFSEITPAEREAELKKQEEAIAKSEEAVAKREPKVTETPPQGIGTIPSAYNRTPVPKSYAFEGSYISNKPAAKKVPSEESQKPELDKPTDMEAIKAARAAARQENINLALIQAGLAIAGGQSPNALTNIATGGISGIQAFQEAEKARRAAEVSERELAIKEDYYSGKKDRETLANMIDRERNRDQKARLIYDIRSKAVEQVRKEAEDNAALKTDPIKYNMRIEELTRQWLSSLEGSGLSGTLESPNINLSAIKSNPEFSGF